MLFWAARSLANRKKVACVDVVIDGLLEVETIRADLRFGLLQYDFPATVLPRSRFADLRAEKADSK